MGWSELGVIMLVALVVLGPKRLPEVAQTLGRWYAMAQRLIDTARQQVEEQVQLEQLAEREKQAQQIDQHYHQAADDKTKESST